MPHTLMVTFAESSGPTGVPVHGIVGVSSSSASSSSLTLPSLSLTSLRCRSCSSCSALSLVRVASSALANSLAKALRLVCASSSSR